MKALLHQRGFVLALTALWLVGVGSGTAALWRYSMTPGDPAAAPAVWPELASIHRTEGAYTLVMLVHPHCSCSRASVGELAKLMTRLGDAAEAYVLFMKPGEFEEGWEKTDLWRRVEEIPGVTAVLDEEGRGAARFGAKTSGQVVLFDPAGRLLFAGGITGGRGHEGDNIGASRLVSLVTQGRADSEQASVYGCELTD